MLDSATLWTVACQVLLSIGLSRKGYWSGLPFLLQGIFPTQGLNLGPSGSCVGRWLLYHQREALQEPLWGALSLSMVLTQQPLLGEKDCLARLAEPPKGKRLSPPSSCPRPPPQVGKCCYTFLHHHSHRVDSRAEGSRADPLMFNNIRVVEVGLAREEGAGIGGSCFGRE